mgnify:CR=1 FL=1
MRLDRWLVTLGEGSRSQLQRIIRAGRVTVNGSPLRDPSADCDTEGAALTVDGRELDGRLTRHIMLCKPAGLLTAARDKKQPTVMDLFPPSFATMGCMPVGRLDKDTTGLLLLTTDGELNHRLLSPKRHVWKTYEAEVDGPLTAEDEAAFHDGMELGDFVSAEAELCILQSGNDSALARVRVHEGKFHQIKRMFEHRGRTVTRLRRLTFGSLTLDETLEDGAWRELTKAEIAALYADAAMEENA